MPNRPLLKTVNPFFSSKTTKESIIRHVVCSIRLVTPTRSAIFLLGKLPHFCNNNFLYAKHFDVQSVSHCQVGYYCTLSTAAAGELLAKVTLTYE